MGLFTALFGNSNQASRGQKRLDHTVIISFYYGLKDIKPLNLLEEQLKKTIEEKLLGEYDGYEISDDLKQGSVYMNGSNAEDLFKGIKVVLENFSFMRGAKAKLIFGNTEK